MEPLTPILLVILFLWAMNIFTHAAMDNIKDQRTHLGLHPYGDFWHGLQYLREISVFFMGYFSHLFMLFASINKATTGEWLGYLGIILIAVISYRVIIWNTFYHLFKDTFLGWDKQNLIDVGPKWLQKILGFHW